MYPTQTQSDKISEKQREFIVAAISLSFFLTLTIGIIVYALGKAKDRRISDAEKATEVKTEKP